jgi:hypothetical protein
MTARPLNGPYGNAFTVNTYMSRSSSQRRSRDRSAGSPARVAADAADSRSDTPYRADGDTRAFTAGANSSSEARISAQVSPACTSVEYAR